MANKRLTVRCLEQSSFRSELPAKRCRPADNDQGVHTDAPTRLRFSFNSLPFELLERILTHLPPRELIYVASLVCRVWRDCIYGLRMHLRLPGLLPSRMPGALGPQSLPDVGGGLGWKYIGDDEMRLLLARFGRLSGVSGSRVVFSRSALQRLLSHRSSHLMETLELSGLVGGVEDPFTSIRDSDLVGIAEACPALRSLAISDGTGASVFSKMGVTALAQGCRNINRLEFKCSGSGIDDGALEVLAAASPGQAASRTRGEEEGVSEPPQARLCRFTLNDAYLLAASEPEQAAAAPVAVAASSSAPADATPTATTLDTTIPKLGRGLKRLLNAHGQSLKYLDFSGCLLPPGTVLVIRDTCDGLTSLHLNRLVAPQPSADDLVTALNGLPRLTSLGVCDSQLEEEHFDEITLPRLRRLNANFTGISAANLSAPHLTHLTELHVVFSRIDTGIYRTIASKLRSIEVLDLRQTPAVLSDDNAESLAAGCVNLSCLLVSSGNGLSHRGALALSNSCPGLTTLQIDTSASRNSVLHGLGAGRAATSLIDVTLGTTTLIAHSAPLSLSSASSSSSSSSHNGRSGSNSSTHDAGESERALDSDIVTDLGVRKFVGACPKLHNLSLWCQEQLTATLHTICRHRRIAFTNTALMTSNELSLDEEDMWVWEDDVEL